VHISRVQVRSFKRFHDLTIEIPGSPKLVVLCGPNGIGKSSLIDALRLWHGGHGSGEGWFIDETYHRKSGDAVLGVGDLIAIDFVEPLPADPRKLIYARSAYRHEPDFQMSTISSQGEILAAPKSNRMIDSESKVSNNYLRLIAATLDELYGGDHDAETVGALRDRQIGRVREVMRSLFPSLELKGPGDPMGGGTFFFSKAGRTDFHYKNLSGGEKAAFDLVLDLAIKTATYDNSVIAIDEPELHLNPRLQASLLEQLVSLVSDEGQLWVATHSIGMMRKAQEIWAASPAEVAFLDFEDHDFDDGVVMEPSEPSRAFWNHVFEVALGDLAGLLAPDQVVLCEGRVAGGTNVAKAEFDARCYRRIFAREFPRTDFISVGNAPDVHTDRLEIGRSIQTIVTGTKVVRVVDRDSRSADEVRDLEAAGTRVLSRRHLESFLLDDEVLAALTQSLGKPELLGDVLALMAQAIAASVGRGNDPDDAKSAAGEFFVAIRQQLGLVQSGSTVDAFLADTLAPLLQPGLRVYDELRRDLFAEQT
jgi:predicted ATPase